MIIAGDMPNKLRKSITMIELVVAIAVFSIIMLIILDSFIKVINYNRLAAQNQSIQDHSEFIFQLLSREIRLAKINYSGNCNNFYSDKSGSNRVAHNQIYGVATVNARQAMFFENVNGECVMINHDLDPDNNNAKRLRITRCAHAGGTKCQNGADITANQKVAWVTPLDISVEAMTASATNFYNESTPSRHTPATVNYYIKLKSQIWDPPEVELSNFITARNAEQF